VNPPESVRIRLDFQRIQTYLFSVPRLKAMLGANAKLGSLIRKDLFELVARYRGISNTECDQLPTSDTSDPLHKALDVRTNAHSKIADDVWERLRDDPRTLRNQGIVSRDAGHFVAEICSNKLDTFIREANRLFLDFPELLIRWRRYDTQTQNYVDDIDRFGCPTELGSSHVLLPVFEVCRDTGRDPVSPSKTQDNKPIS